MVFRIIAVLPLIAVVMWWITAQSQSLYSSCGSGAPDDFYSLLFILASLLLTSVIVLVVMSLPIWVYLARKRLRADGPKAIRINITWYALSWVFILLLILKPELREFLLMLGEKAITGSCS